jgi:hypothetical protein
MPEVGFIAVALWLEERGKPRFVALERIPKIALSGVFMLTLPAGSRAKLF